MTFGCKSSITLVRPLRSGNSSFTLVRPLLLGISLKKHVSACSKLYYPETYVGQHDYYSVPVPEILLFRRLKLLDNPTILVAVVLDNPTILVAVVLDNPTILVVVVLDNPTILVAVVLDNRLS